jgi:uncharacterized protein YcfJ
MLEIKMRLKTLALALILASGSSFAQPVRYANVVTVSDAHENRVVSYNYQTVCRNESQPIYSNVPIYSEVYHQNPREQPWLRAIAGMLIGAHIGGSGDARVAGALIGGAVGHATSGPVYGQTIVGYSTQIVGYQNRPVCENVQVPIYAVERKYIVVYELDGHTHSVTLPYHPGNTIRVAPRVVR